MNGPGIDSEPERSYAILPNDRRLSGEKARPVRLPECTGARAIEVLKDYLRGDGKKMYLNDGRWCRWFNVPRSKY